MTTRKTTAIIAGVCGPTPTMPANVPELPDKTKSAEPPQHISEAVAAAAPTTVQSQQ